MKPATKVFCLLLLLVCSGAARSRAGWIENGVPLTHQWGSVGRGVMASDGSSGAIIAYQVCHEGVGRIMAQRVDSAGVVQWALGGIDVCTVTGHQQNPQITLDGAGGVIIAWEDYRNGNRDLYAQKVNALGTVLWTADGMVLSAATGDQQNPSITSDGSAGAIVTWMDYRSGDWDIYAQRVDAMGAIQWTSNGVALCTAAGDQYSPQSTFDGAGGAIVAWQDYRGGTADIYVQQVDAMGAVKWTVNGVALCTAEGDRSAPALTVDGAGGSIVAWKDTRGADQDIYAQRIDSIGAVSWTTDGIAICAAGGNQYSPQIASDGVGGAIVTWQDSRILYADIYAQRVNASGGVQWATNGMPLCTATEHQWSPQITSDGASGAIVAWIDSRSGNPDIFAQRVDAAGTVRWTTNGVALCVAAGDRVLHSITFDGVGGAIVAWQDSRNGNADLYGQRVNDSAVVRWSPDGILICTSAGGQGAATITSDGVGGAIVTWMDFRSGSYDIYAERLNPLGAVQWATNGVPLCTAVGFKLSVSTASDGAGGAIVSWMDFRSGGGDIYAQLVNSSGAVQWTTHGVGLCTATGNQQYPRIVSDGTGGAIIAWQDQRSGIYNIYAQRVDATGADQWTANGMALCSAAEDQGSPAIVSDGLGGAIVAWMSSANYDIYVQRVSASGIIRWTSSGVAIRTAIGYQDYPNLSISSDGSGGAICVWIDYRSGNAHIYAQRVNASGAVQWAANGIPLCIAAGWKGPPLITSDGAGGAIVTWSDQRSGEYDIYAQRIDASGVVQWVVDGIALCTAMWDQWSSAIISDDAGGAIVTWTDSRSGNRDIYAQRVNASGAVQWMADGVSLCTPTGDQYNPIITSDDAGGAIVAWNDNRCGSMIYAQRITASGEFVATTLQSYSAALDGSSVQIEWALSEIDADVRFAILRASAPEWEFVELEGAAIAKDRFSYTFTDASCLPGTTYKYRVECEMAGMPKKILFESQEIAIPTIPLTLYQNHPNPFNPQTVIRFYLPETQEIILDVYSVAGERVARLAEGKREKGYHEVSWNGRNDSGAQCASGVYFSRLTAGKNSISRKMVIMR